MSLKLLVTIIMNHSELVSGIGEALFCAIIDLMKNENESIAGMALRFVS